MKPHFFFRLSLALAMAAGLSSALADTIKLKNGTVYNGTIEEETSEMYGMNVVEGQGIKDFKKIPKADVAEVKRDMPDEREADELLTKLKDTPDGMTAPEYEKRIKTQIQPWLDKYKTSKKRPVIEALLKQHVEEAARVKAGDIKLRGVWIMAAEVKWNEYNINARKLRIKMEALKAKQPVEAFTVFAELEAGYVASIDYPPAVEAMRKALPQLQLALTQAAEAQPGLVEERKKLTAALEPDKKKDMEATFAKEKSDFVMKASALKKNKAPVVIFYAYDLKSIEDAVNVLKKDSVRLGALDVAALTATAKKFEKGLKDLGEKAFLSAKTNIEAVAKAYPTDTAVKKKLDEANKGLNDAKAVKPPVPGTKPPGTK